MSWILSGFADEAADLAEDQIKVLKEEGLSHIDVRMVDGCNVADLPIDRAKSLRRQLDAAGVKVCMLGTPIGKIDITDDFQIDIGKLEHCTAVGRILDCNRLRVFSYFNKQSAPPDQWQSKSFSRLRQLKARAADLGVVLYLENEHDLFGDVGKRFKLIVDELYDPTFKTIFDFDNYNFCKDDVWENWLQLRDVTDAFHLKDSDKDGQHVPAGQGTGRVRDILADALSRRWEGPLSLEPHLAHSPAVMATGPSGRSNQKLAEMSPAECFGVATTAVRQLLGQIGAPFV